MIVGGFRERSSAAARLYSILLDDDLVGTGLNLYRAADGGRLRWISGLSKERITFLAELQGL